MGRAEVLISHATAIGVDFARSILDAGLNISDKSVVVGSSKAIANDVARRVRLAGSPLRAVLHAEDLGISTAGGRRRAVASLSARSRRALVRARRVNILA